MKPSCSIIHIFRVPIELSIYSPSIRGIDFRMNTKKLYRKNVWQDGPAIYWRNYMEYRKSSVRSKVEYVFHIMKNIFGYKKVRYKGLEKNFAQQNLLLALDNLYMLGKSDLLKKPRFAD